MKFIFYYDKMKLAKSKTYVKAQSGYEPALSICKKTQRKLRFYINIK
ncbi:hypothetical protein EXN48_10715 [Clostridium botulinum]|uniref:Uncharacterized protein n=2 Tax=Clostridium botulinum TaxID=1491 RepID=A5I4J8_CLOBH|nr:hypothetical protein DB732_12175 [Clostridium botulinum]NFK35192.1 hypothetical protein [Clostridium botulinum H04402 065]CAL83970.1 hypothetical protein CBO2422 [Clostridium botulinum A str. ATCC 3502]AWB30982.1 hypothetical protein DBN47_12170 [Clostridium botulinum]AXG94408.1 hypothetical protein AGE31_01410 [Clostridium botulinum]